MSGRLRSIQARIVLAFAAAALAIAAFTGAVIRLQLGAVERAAQLEAGNLARSVAYGVTGPKTDAQHYVEGLDGLYRRDIVVVDASQTGIADAHRVDIGHEYTRDENDEVGAVIADGLARAFVERSPRHPDGAREMAVPMRRDGLPGGPIVGAVVLEYTGIHDELLHAEMTQIRVVAFAGLACMLVVGFAGARLARSIAQRLQRVRSAVEQVAGGAYDLRLPAMGEDEIGTLAASFNRMSHDLGDGRRQLVDALEQTRSAAQQVEFLARHDRLTGLPNRSCFSELLTLALESTLVESRKVALLFVDIDGFRNINDSVGYAAGDRLLGAIGARLASNFGPEQIVAHVGGDQFVVALPMLEDGAAALAESKRLLAEIGRPITQQEQQFSLSASIGIAVFPDHGDDERTLLQRAEIALQRAKEDGKNCCVLFTPQLDRQSVERLAFESSLHRALARGEFRLHYQPKVDCRTGRTGGVEALLRWEHPDLGTVPPAKFVPVAEENGLIVPLGRWVLRTACEQQVRWRAQGLPALRVAVNLSARQFSDEDLLADIEAIVAETGIDPTCLELEITESMLMRDVERARRTLEQIKRLGISLSVDDFGTGYSSLSHLKRFPIDTLKIDRAFVRDLAVDEDDRAIAVAIIAMAKTLHLGVVAEGAETREQVEFLRDHGCDEIQGWYFAKAVPPEQIPGLLAPRAEFGPGQALAA